MQASVAHPTRPAIGAKELVFLLALLQALQALAIDVMLPALGVISQDLGVTSANHRQLIIGIFLLSGGIGALLPGALADRFGRRKVLAGALILYIVTALGCALVRDFNSLLVMRALQGFGCAGLAVIPPAIIRDRFEGDRMAKLQSLIQMIFMLVPMLAPSLGQAILIYANWRWIFAIMALLAALVSAWAYLRLPETLHPEFRQSIEPRTILANMGNVLTTRSSIGYVLGSALMMSATWGYINSSQQLLAEHFGAGARFPLIFGGMALAIALASLTNSRIVERFGARRVSHAATITFIAAAAVQVLMAFAPHETLWQFLAVMSVNLCLIGFTGANFSSIALQPFARTAGAAASVQTFLRMVIASTIGSLIGQAYDGSARPLALALLIAGICTLGLVLFSEHGKLFRRLYPAGTPRESNW